jgi:hypothetical protein
MHRSMSPLSVVSIGVLEARSVPTSVGNLVFTVQA